MVEPGCWLLGGNKVMWWQCWTYSNYINNSAFLKQSAPALMIYRVIWFEGHGKTADRKAQFRLTHAEQTLGSMTTDLKDLFVDREICSGGRQTDADLNRLVKSVEFPFKVLRQTGIWTSTFPWQLDTIHLLRRTAWCDWELHNSN